MLPSCRSGWMKGGGLRVWRVVVEGEGRRAVARPHQSRY